MTIERIPGFCALCRSRCGCISVVEDGSWLPSSPTPRILRGLRSASRGEPRRSRPRSDRLLHPMRRTRPKGDPDAGWEPIGWDEALDWTAGCLRDVAERTDRRRWLSPRRRRPAPRCPTPSRGSTVSSAPSAARTSSVARKSATGTTTSRPRTPSVPDPFTPDFERTGCLLLWGHNPANTYVAQANAIAEMKARGAALVSWTRGSSAWPAGRTSGCGSSGGGRCARARVAGS